MPFWPGKDFFQAINGSSQTITTTTETVICTLAGVYSRSPSITFYIQGYAFFAVNASTTATTLRVRSIGLTGTLISSTSVEAQTAGTTSQQQFDISAQDTPAGEYSNQTYVLTIQATAAAANWNVNFASLITNG